MVAINSSDDCNSANSSSSSSGSGSNWLGNRGCNKFERQQRQPRISLSENHNSNSNSSNNNNNSSSSSNKSNIDVETFTNTKELNQLNLNSSSTTLSSQSLATSLEAASATTTTTTTKSTAAAAATTTIAQSSSSSSSSTPLAILATATVTEITRQQQQQQQQQQQRQQQQQQQRQRQQLIMSPTALASCAASCSTSANTPASVTVTATSTATAAAAVHLRKSHSTPALKFDGTNSNIVDNSNSSSSNSSKYCNRNHVESAMEASNIAIKDVAVVAHIKRQQHQQQQHQQQQHQQQQHQQQQQQQHEQFPHDNNKCNNIDATQPTTPESLRFGCTHYKRRAMFVTPCCNKFYKCRFCHDENESHHFDRKTLTELICSECNTRQKVQEQCEKCGVRFGKYTCLICNLFDDADKQQYHCHGCGICRIGGAHNFFHCEVCNMCLPMQLKIDGHRCVENISRSHCPVCLGDIHTSRIPCHIPDCGHLLHKMCFDQLLASGHYTCPTCQTSLIDMTALWEYLDAQALRMPVPLKYENQRVHIFCNDCHKTSKTKFHFIGLKCVHCGAYNTTQDVKRRLSLVTDEPTTA